MKSKITPCFEKSKGQRVSNRGLLKNRFEFFGVLNKGFLKIDAGELVMYEDISYTGQVKKDLFQGEGELKLPDGISMRGIWNCGMLTVGRIHLKDINILDYIEINRKDNTYKLKVAKDAKLQTITDNLTLDFQEHKNDITIHFKLNDIQGLTIYIVRKVPTLTLSDKHYTISTIVAPMLYFVKDYSIEDSKIIFSIYPSYKVEYVLKTLKTENRYNLKHFIVFPEGKCFMGKVDNIPKGDKQLNAARLCMPGILIDLDEYLIDGIKLLNFYDVFSIKTGNKRLLKKPSKKVKRVEIEKSLFAKLITSLQQKKPILKQLVLEEIDRCQMKFDWRAYGPHYFDGVMVITKDSFDYQKRLSKNFVNDVVEKSLIQFNWMIKQDTYFHNQILNE